MERWQLAEEKNRVSSELVVMLRPVTRPTSTCTKTIGRKSVSSFFIARKSCYSQKERAEITLSAGWRASRVRAIDVTYLHEEEKTKKIVLCEFETAKLVRYKQKKRKNTQKLRLRQKLFERQFDETMNSGK